MKKFIVLGLFGLLIMAFSTAAYAQDKLEFKASGAFEAVSFLYRNIASGATGDMIATRWPGANLVGGVPAGAPGRGFRPEDPATIIADSGAWNRTISYLEYRGILRFDAIMGKGLSGTVIFEMDSSRWGEGPFGADGTNRGQLGFWTADRAGVEVKNLYIDFALPYLGIPVPMTARVGIQPLGARPHIFMITDGAGITGGFKIDPVLINIQWAKAVEGRDGTADDVNVYGININAKLGPITPGFFTFFFNADSYPLQVANAAAAVDYGITVPYRANLWWFGAYLDGKLGPLNLNFDVVYDYGKVYARENALGILAEDKVKYSGWATQLKIAYPWEKFEFGGVGTYASGADLRKTSRGGLPGQAVADINQAGAGTTATKVGSYVIPPGSEQWAAWGESMILSNNYIGATALPLGMWPSLGSYPIQANRGAIGGTWIAKLFGSFKPISWYKITFAAMYIGDTTKHGNTLGNAVRDLGGGNWKLRDDSTIGWEFDLVQDIQLYNNLKWSIGLGYMIAGKALDQKVGGVETLGPWYNGSPKDPWILATKLRYDF